MITLKTLPQATAQEVFDQVVNHLKTQNKQSYDESAGSCVYRSDDGLKCAAGCLIGDDEYRLKMENPPNSPDSTWTSLVKAKMVPIEHKRLIVNLQSVHDLNRSDEDFYLNCVNGLREISESYNLEFKE